MLVLSAVRSEFADDPDFRDLLQTFVAEVPDRVRELRGAFDAGDPDRLLMAAHQLRGAGGGYGFAELSRLAGELETACRGRSPRIAARLEDTLAYLDRLTAG